MLNAKFISGAIQKLLLLAVFLTPLMYGSGMMYPMVTGKVFFFFGIVQAIFFLWLYLLAVELKYRPSKKLVLWLSPAFLLILWLSITGLTGVDSLSSFWGTFSHGTGLVTLWHLFAFALIIGSFAQVHGMPLVRKLFIASMLSGVVTVLVLWLGEYYGIGLLKGTIGVRGGGLLDVSSQAGAFVAMNIFLAFFLLFSSEVRKKYKWWLGAFVVFMALSPLFISFPKLFAGELPIGQARGATIGLVIGVIFALSALVAFSRAQWRQVVGVGMIILILAFGVFTWKNLTDPETRLHQGFIEGASGTRFVFWDIAKDAVEERPILGWGLENYLAVHQKYFRPYILLPEYGYEGYTDRAHNVVWEMGVSGGIPAITLYFTLVISLILSFFITWRKGIFSPRQAAILSALPVAYFVQNLFVFDAIFTYLVLFLIVGVMAGILAEGHQELSGKIMQARRTYFAWFLAIIFIIAFIFLTYRPAQKAVLSRQMPQAPVGTLHTFSDKFFKSSKMGNNFDLAEWTEQLYHLYVRTIFKTEKNEASADLYDAIESNTRELLSYSKRALELHPDSHRNTINTIRLMDLLALLSDDEEESSQLIAEALALAEKVVFLAPTNPEVYWMLGPLVAQSGDVAGAIEIVKYAIELEPRHGGSHYLLIQFARASGNLELLREAEAHAIQVFGGVPSQENNFFRPEDSIRRDGPEVSEI